jgi:flavin reductase (DIM6/NTAB) family NADH-FMN oxidoreductase RutF
MPKIELRPDTLLNPMPVVLASVAAPDQKPNLITLAWVGIASSDPPSVSIAIRPSRYSFELLQKSGEFVIAVPNAEMVEAVDYCGVVSGREVDKFAATGLTPLPASQIGAPLVAEAPVNLECKVTHQIDLNVHHLFIGEVVAVHVEESLSPEGKKLDIEASSPIVYCYASHEYRKVGEVIGTHGFAKKKFS